MSRCKGCKAEIEWIETRRGKAMAIDPAPLRYSELQAGDTVVSEDGDVLRITHAKVDRYSTLTKKFFVAHWATCTNAAEFRRSRR